MNSPDSTERNFNLLAEELYFDLNSKTRKIAGDVSELIESGSIEDATDLKIVNDAVAFVESPGTDIETIKKHTTMIEMVCSGFEMQGADVPPALDALHAYLFALQCINRIGFIVEKIDQGATDTPEFKLACAQALDWATILSRGYKDNTMLDAVTELLNSLG